MFLGAPAVLLDVGLEVEVDIRDVNGDADHAADDDAGEDDADLTDIEVIDADVCEREGLNEGVVDVCNQPSQLGVLQRERSQINSP